MRPTINLERTINKHKIDTNKFLVKNMSRD